MKRAAVVLASLVLSACGGLAPDQAADPAQITIAQNRFDDCLRTAVRRVDDRKMDEAFLAETAMGSCSIEWHAVMTAQTAGMSITASLMFEDQATAQERTEAIAIVVEERRAPSR